MLTVSSNESVPTPVPETQTSVVVQQPSKIGTLRDLAQEVDAPERTQQQSHDTVIRQPSKIGTLRDLAQDINNELTEHLITESPKHDTAMPTSVHKTVVRQPSKIGTLRDFAQDNELTESPKQDINNELTEQSFDLKPAELATPRRSESVDAPGVQGAPCTSDIELFLNTIRKEIESEYKRYYGES